MGHCGVCCIERLFQGEIIRDRRWFPMPTVSIVVESKFGNTAKVAEAIAKSLTDSGFGEVTVSRIRNNKETDLSSLEAEILQYMYSRKGGVITREELLENIWGYEKFPTTRTIDNHILKLRKKIEKNPNHPVHLLSVYGEGYRFVVD